MLHEYPGAFQDNRATLGKTNASGDFLKMNLKRNTLNPPTGSVRMSFAGSNRVAAIALFRNKICFGTGLQALFCGSDISIIFCRNSPHYTLK